jgi:hypothetical protein
MSRVIKDGVWLSSKLASVQPQEWRPEYVWLLIGSFVDGTFEADPARIWARAYAYSRPDWSAEKVAKLLDEFERVGLLQRTKDEQGRVWGLWTGPQYVKVSDSRKTHYAVGKSALFTQALAKVQPLVNQGLAEGQLSDNRGLHKGRDCEPGVCVGVGVGASVCACVGVCVCQATKSSENNQEQLQDQKPVSEEISSSKATPKTEKPKATQSGRVRDVKSPVEFAHAKAEQAAAEERASSAQWRKDNGYEECADGIWRPEPARTADAWTILGEGEVWKQDPAVTSLLAVTR